MTDTFIEGVNGDRAVNSILHWRTMASVPAIVAAVVVSATVGLFFGIYPAWKASRMGSNVVVVRVWNAAVEFSLYFEEPRC